MTKYPTKDKIMKKEQMFKPKVLIAIKLWSKKDWNKIKYTQSPQKKINSLKNLATTLSQIYDKPVNIKYIHDYPTCYYSPTNKTIYIVNNPSIISFLHEFAHHIFGPNEEKACKWSVWLFKKTFPKSFIKLKWKGHMLFK